MKKDICKLEEKINYSYRDYDDDYIQIICDHIKNSSFTKHIKFIGNSLYDKQIEKLLKSLENNTVLEAIELCYNYISFNDDIFLNLKLSKKLKYIDLNSNKLTNNGLKNLVNLIVQNNLQLEYLDISDNNFNRLPAELALIPNSLTKFYYLNNEIDFVPLNVSRWLNRFQEQQNSQIYRDTQNVHNRIIQDCVVKSMFRIMNAGDPYYNSETLNEIILNDNILTEKCKLSLIRYSQDNFVHTSLNLTFSEVLCYVFSRIRINENSKGIKEILNQEMLDSENKCFTGRITRLINCLNILDPLVKINLLSDNQQINNICNKLYETMKNDIDDDNTLSNRFCDQVEILLKEHGFIVTDKIRSNNINPIAELFTK